MLKNLVNLFFPPVCSGCHSFLMTNETVICTKCRHDLPQTNHHIHTENEAFKKFYGRIPVIHASAFLYFHKKGMVQELIHNLKYRGHQEIGTQLGYWYAEDLKNNLALKNVDAIIPVPIHKKRWRKRGYNQAEIIAKCLSEKTGVSLVSDALFRVKKTTAQKKLDRQERMGNLRDAFALSERWKPVANVLLIDDIYTTGATVEQAAKILKKAGAQNVYFLTISIGQGI